MCLYSFVFHHTFSLLDPGPVDQAYFDDYQERYGSQYLRHCAKCERSKPPRCHHCSICKVGLSLLRVTVDVCCEYGSPLSLALQLHWVQQQEVFRPIPLLCLCGLHLHHPPFCLRHDSLLQTAPKHAEEDDLGILHRTLVMADGQV